MQYSLSLITNKEMLACNQNGVMGKLVYDKNGIEIWNTPKKNSKDGWFGVFNRTDEVNSIDLSYDILGLSSDEKYDMVDVWQNSDLKLGKCDIKPNGVLFVKYVSR